MIFIILVGVALFAALSFAVGQMLREGSPQTISREQNALKAAAIIDYGRALRQAVQTIRINGCDETEISFTVDGADGYQHTPEAPDSCKIFNPSGGGMIAQNLGPDGEAWKFTSYAEVNMVGSTCSTAACVELIAWIVFEDDDLCDTLNTKLGLQTDINGKGIPVTVRDTVPKFTGTYTRTTIFGGGGTATPLKGVQAGCMNQTLFGMGVPQTPTRAFYQVLLPR